MVHLYAIGSPSDDLNLGLAERNLSKLLKTFWNAATGYWTESKPLVIYGVEVEKKNGYVTSFRGKVIGKYWGDWQKNRAYYKTGSKLYSVSKDGRLTEIRRK